MPMNGRRAAAPSVVWLPLRQYFLRNIGGRDLKSTLEAFTSLCLFFAFLEVP
jgi:hypothetical protein